MPNVITNPTNFQRRINNYVPAMMYSSDVNYNGATRVSFGAPVVAASTGYLASSSVAVAGVIFDMSATVIPETYGRCIQVVAGAAATSTVIFNGWDYLGQPLQETITLNGTTPVQGKKAFKTFGNMTVGTTTATTVTAGPGTGLGLPYKALRVAWEVANGAGVAAGTLTQAVLTDPQTTSTGDPRGTYVPTTTLNGSNIISGIFDFVNDVNSSNNGGLHGIRQFGG